MNINNDLLIHRYRDGIKLMTPNSNRVNGYYDNKPPSISSILRQPFNIFFVNHKNELNKINHVFAEICGFDSENAAIGKKPYDILTKESADFSVKMDDSVMREKKIKIYERDFIRKDGKIYQNLVIKSPWYDNEDKIIGIFGCSISLGIHALAQSLHVVSGLGLLSKNEVNPNSSKNNKVYLSKQQLSCAKLLVAGLTAKEIASQLNLSHRTVEAYLEHIKNKLYCRNKTDLVLKLAEILKSDF